MDAIHPYLINDKLFFTIGVAFVTQTLSLSVRSSVLPYVNGCAFIVLSNGEQLFRVAKYHLKQENLNVIRCNILCNILQQLNQCLTHNTQLQVVFFKKPRSSGFKSQ